MGCRAESDSRKIQKDGAIISSSVYKRLANFHFGFPALPRKPGLLAAEERLRIAAAYLP